MQSRIVNNRLLVSSLRFDSSYHNAEVNIYDEVLTCHSTYNLSHYCSAIYTSGRNKRLYTEEAYGTPFLSNSDVMSANPFLTCKYTSRKYGSDDSGLLKEGMILTGRVGAIGQTAYVPKYWEEKKAIGSDNIIRIEVKPEYKSGFIYAYLASKVGCSSFWKHATGGVQPFITDKMVGGLPIPDFPTEFQERIDSLIKKGASLRGKAYSMLEEAEYLLKQKASLVDLSSDLYDFYGPHGANRSVSCYTINIKNIGTTTINAFNHSERIRRLKTTIKCKTIPLEKAIINGQTYSSTGAPSIEVKPGRGIMLINQKDIFDNIIKGKWISRRGVNLNELVEYGEVLIACDGTLGEGELFCRAIFANEDLAGAFISSHFLRMKTVNAIPSGYLYTWLNSDYGFRLIRNTQAGTKLCHPINKLFLRIPVPIIDEDSMKKIDELVREAHTYRHQANQLELEAISTIETEIDQWNKN